MSPVKIIKNNKFGYNFIPTKFIPEGKDEYYIRNRQFSESKMKWRNLSKDEINILIENHNISTNWKNIYVADPFDPHQIKNSEFYGMIRICGLEKCTLNHHDLNLPAGINNSKIISCDIGENSAIHNVSYLSHYIIGDNCILINIGEMHTTNYAKFGNGIIKDGEKENIRVWLDLINETGSRKVIPFDGMIPADAYIWSKYKDDTELQARLIEITQSGFDSSRGYYGTIGNQTVIKHSRILKDVIIGDHCYIKGANKLKNLTINSSEAEPVQIGEGVELVNGIIGFGCHIFYGCKAIRFIMGNNTNLKYGARLLNSFLGDNSTVSCCEILNNLIYPAHEQHHNNSFLIAALVLGQSNLAAGATIGSNHNSRANDNEIIAGRGFWPGLCSSVKHSCRFASFVLLSKADYPAELDIKLPFSLLNNNTADNQLEVMPAFWWLYNMYALARNTWKFKNRDKRKSKVQNIEFDSLAPDTIEEIFNARTLLEIWTAKAFLIKNNKSIMDSMQLQKHGKELLSGKKENISSIIIFGENMEKSKRKTVILKVYEGYNAYGQMMYYYAVKNLMEYIKKSNAGFKKMVNELAGERCTNWVNIGGQLIPESDLDKIRDDIRDKKLNSWKDIHKRYDRLWNDYTIYKYKHAYAVLCEILNSNVLSLKQWEESLDKAIDIKEHICNQVYISRNKDFHNQFRINTYRNIDEMNASIGTIKENSFIKQVKKETVDFKKDAENIKKRG